MKRGIAKVRAALTRRRHARKAKRVPVVAADTVVLVSIAEAAVAARCPERTLEHRLDYLMTRGVVTLGDRVGLASLQSFLASRPRDAERLLRR